MRAIAQLVRHVEPDVDDVCLAAPRCTAAAHRFDNVHLSHHGTRYITVVHTNVHRSTHLAR